MLHVPQAENEYYDLVTLPLKQGHPSGVEGEGCYPRWFKIEESMGLCRANVWEVIDSFYHVNTLDVNSSAAESQKIFDPLWVWVVH